MTPDPPSLSAGRENELATKRAEVGQRSQLLRDVANELDIHHRDFARIVGILDWWEYEGGDASA